MVKILAKCPELGYGILAIAFIKAIGIFSLKEYMDIREHGMEWMAKHPNIIMGGAREEMGMNVFIISLHKNYSDYSDFMFEHRLEMEGFVEDVQTVLVDLRRTERLKPFHLKYFANAK